MKKRITAFLITAVLVLSISGQAFAEPLNTERDLTDAVSGYTEESGNTGLTAEPGDSGISADSVSSSSDKSDADAGTEKNADAEVNAGTEKGTDDEANTDTEKGADAEVNAGTEKGADAEVNAGTEKSADAEVNAGTEKDADAEVNAGTEKRADTDTDTGADGSIAAESISEVVDLELMQEGGLPAEEAFAEDIVNEDGISLEECVKSAIDNREESVDISGFGLEAEEAAAAFAEIINNNPRYFFLSGENVPLTVEADTGLVMEVGINYTMSEGEINAAEKVIDDELGRISAFAAEAPEGELNKALALHEYFALNFCYHNPGPGEDEDTYDAIYDVPRLFIYRQGVCQAFALAFRLAADDLGLTSGYACGYNAYGYGGHAWNAVMVDGNWYMVDTTWDSGSCVAGFVERDNFLKSTSVFDIRHGRFSRYSSYSGFNKEDAVDTTYDSFWWDKTAAFQALYPLDGYWYYLERTGTLEQGYAYRICRTNTAYSRDNSEVVFEGNSNVTVGSAMTVYNGRIYFTGKGTEDSNPCSIYSIAPDSTDAVLEYRDPEGKEVLFAGELYDNLYYSTDFTEEGSRYLNYNKRVVLSGGEDLSVSGVKIVQDDFILTEETAQLSVEVRPETAADKTVYWESSDHSVIMVDDNGLVTAVGAGTSKVSAVTRNGNCRDSIMITVTKSSLIGSHSVYVSGKSETEGTLFWTPAENATGYYVYQVIDDNNTETENDKNDYYLLGYTEGTSYDLFRDTPDEERMYCVVATDGSGRTRVGITYTNWNAGGGAVEGLECKWSTVKLSVKNPDGSVSYYYPERLDRVDISFTPNEEADSYEIYIIILNPDGTMQKGTAAIMNSSPKTIRRLIFEPGYGAIFYVRAKKGIETIYNMSAPFVLDPPEKGLVTDPVNTGVYTGESVKITPVKLPADSDIDLQKVRWINGSTAIASVDANGNVTGHKAGKTSVYVRSVDMECIAVCEITVNAKVFTGVDGSFWDLIYFSGITKDDDLIWSSGDNSIISVNNDGTYTAYEPGEAEITVQKSDGSFKETYTVSAVRSVSGVTLNKKSITLVKGHSYTLKATVLPDDAYNKEVIWESSNPAAVSVSSSGKVTAEGSGSAVITARTAEGGYTAECTVNVNVPVTGVTLNKKSITLAKGHSYTLKATVLPDEASDKSLIWSSSNPKVASVNKSGKVTSKGAGTAVITVKTTDGGYTAKCTVKVTVPVTGVTLNKKSIKLAKGHTYTLKATVLPSDAQNKAVTWSSSNTKVATVSSAGKVTGKNAGTAVVTVTTKDGSFKANCKITVTIPVSRVTLNKSTVSLKKGSTYQLKAAVYPSNASNKQVTWSSSNTKAVTVSSTGKITAKSTGKAVITVKTTDGGYTAKCTVTVSAS